MNEEKPINYFDRFERTHPLAEVAFRQLGEMNELSKRHVLDAARHIITSPTIANKGQARAFKTLARWLNETGTARTSKTNYNQWHASQPYGTPSSSSIAREFGGSWIEAIDVVCSRPKANFNAVRRRARGKVFSRKEILDALREWAAFEEARLTKRNYRIWACCESRSRRMPRDTNMIARRFGSFTEALHEAGLTDRVRFEQSTRARCARIPDSELIDAVREFLAADCGTGVKAFNKYRAELLDNGKQIPNERTVRERLGDGKWRLVLRRFGAGGTEE